MNFSGTTKTTPLGFRTYYGTATMGFVESISVALMTSWFMVYLTDYAGIGKWATTLGIVVLFVVKAFDAVNDPIEGWIMDRARVGRYGKYKPFIILSIFLMAISTACLFCIPVGITNNPIMISVWIVFFYLMLDVGASFYAPNLIYRTLTLDSTQRGTLMIAPRFMGIMIGAIGATLISIVNAVNAGIGDLHTAFGVTVVTLVAICAVIALVGISLVKEKHHPQVDEKTGRVKLSDIFRLIKENKALRIKISAGVFGGFMWTFMFAAGAYYIKWAYCADLTTGVVDTGLYGVFSMVGAALSLVPIIVGTVIAIPLMKAIGSALKIYRLMLLIEMASCAVMFILQMAGILQHTPALYFICSSITGLAIGINFIPEETLNIEVMDYEIYLHGKDRSALCNNACNKFLNKAQSAVASAIIGILLGSIGYVVDSATDTYIGELSALPSMLNWFIVITGLIPVMLGIVAWLISGRYPVTSEIRNDMKRKLSENAQ